MADTTTTANLRAKKWSKKFFRYGLFNSFFGKFVGKTVQDEEPRRRSNNIIRTDDNAVVQVVMDLTKEKGDTIVFPLLYPLTGNGQVNGTLEGNEVGIANYDYSLSVVDWGHATRDAGPLTRQQAAFEWDPRARFALQRWYARALDSASYKAMAGLAFAGDNATDLVAVDPSSRQVYCGSPAGVFDTYTTDTLLSAAPTAYFDLQVVRYVRRYAVASEPTVRPIMVGSDEMYLMFLHPYQVKALKDSTAWNTLQQSSIAYRGMKNPLFKGALGVYDNVILHEYQRAETRTGDALAESLTTNTFDAGDQLTNGGDVARALFCGAQACAHAYAMRPKFTRKDFDYGRKHGYAVDMLIGVGRPEFNDIDVGVIPVDTCVLAD